MKRTLRFISAAAGGYLLGTVPSAGVASRLATGGSAELRSSGTGNPGGMNARRVLGHRFSGALARLFARCGYRPLLG
jgi:glycerol-3-phosphate acyltransferase PlsY